LAPSVSERQQRQKGAKKTLMAIKEGVGGEGEGVEESRVYKHDFWETELHQAERQRESAVLQVS